MTIKFLKGIIMALMCSCTICSAQAGVSGHAKHEDVLLGMHFTHYRTDCNTTSGVPNELVPNFWDYVKYMPEDLQQMSYADFWHWWYEFERYKGDERGFAEMDAIFDECLKRGIKVKIDVCWSTWFTEDKDWETDDKIIYGPNDLGDWSHLCDQLGRRYRGKMVLWMLQGEAYDLENYWKGATIEHVAQAYIIGSRALKRTDPKVMVSVAGASPSRPADQLDYWVNYHAKACKGYYDDIPMNYFGDIADPYKGLLPMYKSIRKAIDDAGETEAEVGSGESAFNWAESTEHMTKNPPRTMEGFDPDKTPLCELKQSWRCNESLGGFFDIGGNKFVMWGTEYAPGQGWPWRWGYRKYQDWLGNWPESSKIPGTNIVYYNETPDGKKHDMRPGWTSAQTDPFHPMWFVYKYWAQTCPPGAEAIRIPMSVRGSGPRIFKIATYLQNRNECVALVQNDQKTAVQAVIDLKPTGWSDGMALDVTISNQSIDYAVGTTKTNFSKTIQANVAKGAVAFKVPMAEGFSTVKIRLTNPKLSAKLMDQVVPAETEVGETIDCRVILRNTGSEMWRRKATRLAFYNGVGARPQQRDIMSLTSDVKPGFEVVLPITLPASDAPERAAYRFRLMDGKDKWFGPTFTVAAIVKDSYAPRKLVALRELGHTRLKWFAPVKGAVKSYEIYRTDEFAKPMTLLTKTKDTEYVDTKVKMDQAYYYQIVAIDDKDRASRPSNEDNAKGLSKSRIYDAEMAINNVPAKVKLGELNEVEITIKNTGQKAWDLGKPGEMHFFLNTTQQWGTDEERVLPKIDLGSGVVKPGDIVSVKVPYVGIKEGRFENHWIVSIDKPKKQRIYFGSPLLVETVVTQN